MDRYGIGDERLAKALIRAKNAGFGEIKILTDLNQSLVVNWPAPTRLSNNFLDPLVQHRDGPTANTMETLLAAGFQFAIGKNQNAPYSISSVPLKDDKIEKVVQKARAHGQAAMHDVEAELAELTGAVEVDESVEARGHAAASEVSKKIEVNNDAMGDLMHLKEFLTYRIQRAAVEAPVGRRGRAGVLSPAQRGMQLGAVQRRTALSYEYSTSNAVAPNERYNRSYIERDREIAQYALDHNLAFAATMSGAETKEISDTPVMPPLRKLYPLSQVLLDYYAAKGIVVTDAHMPYKQISYTDGRYDINLDTATQLRSMIENPQSQKLALFVGSQFAPTYKQGADALVELMEADHESPIFFVSDYRFSSLRGWGRPASFLGFPVLRMRNAVSPKAVSTNALFDSSDRLRIKSFIWKMASSQFLGNGEFDPDGAPYMDHLWHDKTTLIFKQEDGVLVAYLYTGSMNWSGHFQSQEMQISTRIPIAPLSDALLEKIRDEAKESGSARRASRVGRFDTLRGLLANAGQFALIEIFDSIVNTVDVAPQSAKVARFSYFEEILAYFTGHAPHEMEEMNTLRIIQLMTVAKTAQGETPTVRSANGDLAKELLRLYEKPSKMTARYRPSREEFLENVDRLERLMNWWTTHRAAQGMSPYKMMLAMEPLAYGISSRANMSMDIKGLSPFQAKQALAKALGGRLGDPATQRDLEEVWNLLQMRFIDGDHSLVPFPVWKPRAAPSQQVAVVDNEAQDAVVAQVTEKGSSATVTVVDKECATKLGE